MRKLPWIVPLVLTALLLLSVPAPSYAADADEDWITTKGEAAGTGANAEDEATKAALRKAVEQACGVFLTSQSRTEDFKAVYDKVLANTVGYVKRYKVVKMTTEDGKTVATIQSLVSKQKFEEDWANIAHTLHQENNPRVIVSVAESTMYGTTQPVFNPNDTGTVQGKIEDFFLSHGITLTDRDTASGINRRDLLLASIKDDEKELAAIGSRFKAEVLVWGKANAKFGGEFDVEGQKMYRYTASLNIRVIQTDSARVLVSKSFGPVTATLLQQQGGEEKVLAKLAEESAPKVLAAVVEAWRQRATVTRTVIVSVSGMDYALWKKFHDEAMKIDGMQALRLREITEGVANIDVEYKYSNENLADRLTELKIVPLDIQEITSNRIKMKVKAAAPAPTPAQ